MMPRVFILLLFICGKTISQSDSALIHKGSKAPAFVLTLQDNAIQSFGMPYMKKVLLLHFWNSSVPQSKVNNRYLNQLAERYQKAQYKSIGGFEVIAISVQTDKNEWVEAIKTDTLTYFIHGIAQRGYRDDVCKKFGVTTVPTDILIDENGIVLSINPRIMDIENYLDDKKNTQPIKKNVTGTLAQSSNKDEPIKFCTLYLFNYYGDSIQKTITTDKGNFVFDEIKLSQDFVLKIDNQVDINTSDPIALYSPRGEFLMDGRTQNNGFMFYIPSRASHKLTVMDTNSNVNYLGQIDVIKHLTFYTNGTGLTPKDEAELKPILQKLIKDKTLKLEIMTHTDARMKPAYARELTANQALAIKSFFEKKGVAGDRIKTIAKGNSELRKICEGPIDCREEDHQLNRRVEFLMYND